MLRAGAGVRRTRLEGAHLYPVPGHPAGARRRAQARQWRVARWLCVLTQFACAGKDVIGLAQTGAGKTGAFALPILQARCGLLRPLLCVRVSRACILTATRLARVAAAHRRCSTSRSRSSRSCCRRHVSLRCRFLARQAAMRGASHACACPGLSTLTSAACCTAPRSLRRSAPPSACARPR